MNIEYTVKMVYQNAKECQIRAETGEPPIVLLNGIKQQIIKVENKKNFTKAKENILCIMLLGLAY